MNDTEGLSFAADGILYLSTADGDADAGGLDGDTNGTGNPESLWTVNPATGEATLVGSLVQSFSDMTNKISMARDEAELSKEQAERERAYLRAVLGRLSSGVITLDREMNVRVANSAASQILEIDMDRTIGSHLKVECHASWLR